jgi:UDP-glucose 4-epimerase
MRILVTGAAGFVGYAVASLLTEHGHQVTGLTRSPASALPPGVHRHIGDIREPTSLPSGELDAVCHLAGLARVRESRADPLRYWQTNVGGMLCLLEWLPKAGADRLIIASTCAVYGEPDRQPIDETAAEMPTSPYGSSKLAADRAAADLAATGSIGAISLRAFAIAGATPGRPDHDETRLIPKLLAVQQGRASEVTINGDGAAVRDFLHVHDMATAFAAALDTCEPGTWRAYNVGSGHPTSIRDVIDTVEQVTGRPVLRRHAPPAPEPQDLRADPRRIRTELGWSPTCSSIKRIVGDAWSALDHDSHALRQLAQQAGPTSSPG